MDSRNQTWVLCKEPRELLTSKASAAASLRSPRAIHPLNAASEIMSGKPFDSQPAEANFPFSPHRLEAIYLIGPQEMKGQGGDRVSFYPLAT